jgi:hypothetical protein
MRRFLQPELFSPSGNLFSGNYTSVYSYGSTKQPTPNEMQGIPFPVNSPLVIDKLRIWSSLIGNPGSLGTPMNPGAKVRLAMYRATSPTNLWPRKLIVDSGDIDAFGVGNKYLEAVVDQIVSDCAMYWLFGIVNSAFIVSSYQGGAWQGVASSAVGSSGGVLNPTSYYAWVVTAATDNGETNPDAADPVASLYMGSDGTATITWDSFDPATAYYIYRSTGMNFGAFSRPLFDWSNSFLATVDAGTTSYTDDGTVPLSQGQPPPFLPDPSFVVGGGLGVINAYSFLRPPFGVADGLWLNPYIGIKYLRPYGPYPDPFPDPDFGSLDPGAIANYMAPCVHLIGRG